MMTNAECVINTIRRRPGTRIPRGEFIVDPGFARDYLRWRTGCPAADNLPATQLLIEFCLDIKLDIVCIHSGAVSQGGPRTTINPADIKYASGKNLFVFWVVNGAFQTAMMTRGMAAFLSQIARSPVNVGSELSYLCDQTIAVMAQGVRSGAHGIIIADDIAYNRGTYTSPDFVEQILVPIWQAQVKSAGDLGVPVFLHSDGNLNGVMPLIVAAGFDGLQCIEPAAGMNIGQIKDKYGSDLCLMGNVDPALLSVSVGLEDMISRSDGLRREVRELMTSAGGTGGYIFGTCSGLYDGMSPELVHLMYELASEFDTASGAAYP